MDSRERLHRALTRQSPDRVPVDFWASRGFLRKLEAELGTSQQQFLDAHDVDLRYIPGPEYVGPPLVDARGEATDLWGVVRVVAEVPVPGGVERYEEVARSPLTQATTVEELLAYDRWPSPDWFDYSGISAQCDAVRAQGRAVVFMGDRLNRISQLKPAMYLRGMEQILVDMALAPEFAETILGKVRSFYLGYVERILEAAAGKLDLLVTGDDFGVQEGLVISLPMWDRFLRDGFAAYLALAHHYGVAVMHHSCGSVRPVVPRLIACGLDVLQSLQPEARDMDPFELKAEFGDRLAFQGGISVQRVLPFGTPDGVRAHVRAVAEALAPDGGYLFGTAHNLQADVPVENALALMQAYRDFGLYR